MFRCALILLAASVPSVSANTIDALAEEDVCVGTDCALNQLQAAGAANKKKLEADSFVESNATRGTKRGSCAVLTAEQDELPMIMEPGNYRTNMKNCKLPGQNLEGVWWIWWGDDREGLGNWFERFMQFWYNKLQFEIFFTFSGCSLQGDKTTFPTVMNMPVALPRQWAFGSILTGRLFQFFQYTGEDIQWHFEDAKFATAPEPYNYELIYIDEDRWSRKTALRFFFIPLGTFTYTMTRVVDKHGKKTQYWKNWMEDGDNYRTWDVPREESCQRNIAGLTQIFYFPLSWSCWLSNTMCR